MIEVEIEDAAWTGALTGAADLARQAAVAAAAPGETREIAVLLTDDAALKALNARFLGKDRPTNVLAFPDVSPDRLGDIALAYGVCAAEAKAQAKPLANHLRHLVVHGVLHLIGYDHAGDEDAQRMESIERQLLAGMNIPDPYSEPAPGADR
jgi:probable rRNA maturation factor